MGGSSLAPELFSRVFGFADGIELRVLDSTHPDAVRGFRSWASAQRTLFCVSSKSGTTTEPNAYQAAMAEIAPALDFVAITDPDTALADLARAQEFRAIVEAPADVGGRYSALTVFGLVPAALTGVDLGGLLERARAMADACRAPRASDNPGLALGAAIGEAALAGRDKLTILTSPRLAAFGDWAEQLVAESTGKAGTGIVPIVGEPVRPANEYTEDRFFVFLTLASDPHDDLRALAQELTAAGHPVRHIGINDPLDVGAEFVRWEIATAAAGIVLGIDPFDQPNVQESKDATKALLEAYRTTGALPETMPIVSEPGISITADAAVLGDTPVTVDGALAQLLSLVRPGVDYVAILAYLPMDPDVVDRLQAIRAAIGDAPVPRRRSASAPGSCIRPGSSTRADPTPASSSSSPPIRRRTCRSRAGPSRSAHSSRPRRWAISPRSRSAAAESCACMPPMPRLASPGSAIRIGMRSASVGERG